MSKPAAEYPFQPKSTSKLKAGQYWSFQLKNGRHVAGVVVARRLEDKGVDRRLFLAGLLDWSGQNKPTSRDLESRSLKQRGYVHIKTITENGTTILGEISPCWGFPLEVPNDDSITTWGYGVIRVYAEKHFGSTIA